MSHDRARVRAILDAAKASGRRQVSALEARDICAAYGIPLAPIDLATTADAAVSIARRIGFPVALKIESPDIVHKTDVGGVALALGDDADVRRAFERVTSAARRHAPNADIRGVVVQKMLGGGTELIVGAVTDPVFGKLTAFGLGGVLVELMGDVTFRLAPTSADEAAAMLSEIRGAKLLDGVRGSAAIDRSAVARLIENVGALVGDFHEVAELDFNPVLAFSDGAIAVDVRMSLDFAAKPTRYRPSHEEIVRSMQRIMRPGAVAVIGASAEDGKIGNSVMKNLINGGYRGAIYPIHPRAPEILRRTCYPSVGAVPGEIDIAIFCIPARLVASVIAECGAKKIAGAILIPSGFAEVGEHELQAEVVAAARTHSVRLMGPNIYGFYYTHQNLCATFCTPYDQKGKVALSSQSGGVGMAIIGFSRSADMGVSAIVGLGNKADIDEDDLLTFFEQDPNTEVIAMHVEDLKDGRR